MSSSATLVRTTSTTENDWQLTELVLRATSGQEPHPGFGAPMNTGDFGIDFDIDFGIDDLDAPAAITAAFTYCG